MAFKESMQEAFGDIFQAIKNLSDVAAKITYSSNSGELTLNKILINDRGTNVNVLDTIKFMQGAITTKANSADVYTTTEVNTKLGTKLNHSGNHTFTGNLKINGDLNPKTISGTYYLKSSGGNASAHIRGGAGSGNYMTANSSPRGNDHRHCQWIIERTGSNT